LKRYLRTEHSERIRKDVAFLRRHEASLKRQRLNSGRGFHQESVPLEKKTHTIEEKLVKYCLLKICNCTSRGEYWGEN